VNFQYQATKNVQTRSILKRMKKLTLAKPFFLIAMLAVLSPGCSSIKLNQAPNLLGAIVNNPNLSQYATLLQAAGGLDQLLPGGKGTLFVPSNAALSQLASALSGAGNADRILSLLQGHAIGQALNPGKLGRAGEVSSLLGPALNVVKEGKNLKVGNANVTDAFKAPNGFVYVLDQVLNI
jgi:uncharacterized surface protein with fasciclin (FAS1) repeats